MADRRHDPPLLLIAAAAIVFLVATGAFFQRAGSDFRFFYDSGAAWRAGAPAYAPHVPNLQPPPITVAIFAPLSTWPYPVALTIWLLLNLSGCVAGLALIGRALHHDRATTWTIAALITLAFWGIWFQGQPTGALLYPTTRAWLAGRRGAWARAGLWFAPVILVKPTFALAALLLPWRCWLMAGVISGTLSALSIPLIGWDLWRAWWSLGRHVAWMSWPENVSIWGVVTRWQTGDLVTGRLSDVPLGAMTFIAGVGVSAAVRVWREPDADRKFALALLTTILLSPLGWMHYLPIGAGPFAALWHRGWWVAYACLAVPFPAIYPWLTHNSTALRWAGSIYCVGTLIAWGAVICTRTTERSESPESLPAQIPASRPESGPQQGEVYQHR